MWDRWSAADDFAHQDAERIVEQGGCEGCPTPEACKTGGECVRELEIAEEEKRQ